jgi:RNA polymerase sigma-70 factor (ECF subfamily)
MGSDHGPAGPAEVYEPLRPLLFSIAYRMLGTVSDAEDILQEAFLRYHRRSPPATASARPRRSCRP